MQNENEKSTPTTIRAASRSDAEVIFRFICGLKEKDDLNFEVFKELFLKNLANPDVIYLVADHKGQRVGFISCHGQILLHHMGIVFEIQELYVNEAHRSMGIGKLLLQSLESKLETLSYTSLEVTSNKKRISAHKFYADNGFSQSHLKFTK